LVRETEVRGMLDWRGDVGDVGDDGWEGRYVADMQEKGLSRGGYKRYGKVVAGCKWVWGNVLKEI